MTTPILSPTRCKIGYSGHFWSTYQVIAEEAHTAENAVDPGYWAHVAAERRLLVNDVFEVRCETGAWAIDLVVTEAGQRHCKVKVLRAVEAETSNIEPGQLSTVVVEFKGPVKKHCIIRLSDRSIIKEGISSKVDAIREAFEYEQRLAA